MTPTQGEQAQTALDADALDRIETALMMTIEPETAEVAIALLRATAQPAAPQGVAYAELQPAFIAVMQPLYGNEFPSDGEFAGDHGWSVQWAIFKAGAAASNGQAPAGATLFDEQGFRDWVLRNLPDDTIIGNSAWWADHLTAWAKRFVKAAPTAQAAPAAGAVEGPRSADELARDLKNAIDTAMELRQQIRLMEEHARGEIWRWQTDGANDLATMGNRMGVLIYASDLRNLLDAVPTPPAQAADSVLEDAALLHYALADGGNQSMNWQDVYDDWNGEGYFIDALRAAYKQDAARKQGTKHD